MNCSGMLAAFIRKGEPESHPKKHQIEKEKVKGNKLESRTRNE